MRLLNILSFILLITIINLQFLFARAPSTVYLDENASNRLTRLETKIDNLINTLNERFNQVDRRFQDVLSLITENKNFCGFNDWQHWVYMPGSVEYNKVPQENTIDHNTINKLIDELRLKAKNDPSLAAILSKYNLY
jgi:hypothetical protein